ncbi:MAG: hypothetical protein QME42_05465 [bacterium]|nr:hypothetical protein [bacterium]
MKGFITDKKGISLIEVLLAGIIFVVIMMAVMMVFITGSKEIISAGNSNIAVKLCQEGLEMIKKMNPISIPEGSFPPGDSFDFPPGTYGTITVGLENGTRTVSVRKIIDAESTGTSTSYVEVVVNVTWQEAQRVRNRFVGSYLCLKNK